MRSVGRLSRAEGADAGFRGVVVAAVGEAVGDRFIVGGGEDRVHDGTGGLPDGAEAVAWHRGAADWRVIAGRTRCVDHVSRAVARDEETGWVDLDSAVAGGGPQRNALRPALGV